MTTLFTRIRDEYSVPHDLMCDLQLEAVGAVLDEWTAELARVGQLLCQRGQGDVWREVYRLHFDGAEYTAGDELLFLLERRPKAAS